MTDNTEILKEFFETAYNLIEEKDPVNLEQIKFIIIKSKILNETRKYMIRNYLLSQLLRIYHWIINNKVYQEVNKENIKICLEELKIISLFKTYFPPLEEIENEKILFLYLKLLECLNEIDEIRVDYLEENGNIGRTIASSYHLVQIDELLLQKENIKMQLKRVLEQR